MGRQCEIYEDVVTGQLGMEILTQRQQDAIHVFFIERSELSDGRNTIEIGGFAHALGSSDHRNYVVLTGQQFEYLQPDRNDLEMSDKTAKRFAHEIALLMGTYHDFGDPTNIMSMRIMG